MKLPTAEFKAKPQAKSKVKPQGVSSKSTYLKSTQPTGKLQALSPLKRLASTLAGFKLPEHSSPNSAKSNSAKSNSAKSNSAKSNSAKKSVGIKAADPKTANPKTANLRPADLKTAHLKAANLKTVGLNNTDLKGVPAGVVQDTASQPAVHQATASSAANISLPLIKDSKGSRIAFNLLLVRPWVLLVGFWLFSMVVGAVAVEGMVSPRKLRMALPEATVETTAVTNKNALIKVEQDSEDSAVGIAEDSDTTQSNASSSEAGSISGAAAQKRANRSDGLPVLPLTAMVGTCAAGCLVISRRRAMARMAAARSRSRVRKVQANADASVSKPEQSKQQSKQQSKPGQKVAARKIAKPKVERSSGDKPAIAKSPASALGLKPAAARLNKRRQRSQRAASSQPAASSKRVLVSRFAARPAAPAQQVSSISKARQASGKAKRKSARLATRHQGIVSVVPASESHALDWTNGSLAHQMDVRPSRTASM